MFSIIFIVCICAHVCGCTHARVCLMEFKKQLSVVSFSFIIWDLRTELGQAPWPAEPSWQSLTTVWKTTFSVQCTLSSFLWSAQLFITLKFIQTELLWREFQSDSSHLLTTRRSSHQPSPKAGWLRDDPLFKDGETEAYRGFYCVARPGDLSPTSK